MKAYGLEVYVFVCPFDETLQNKISWITDILGQDWRYRIIAVPNIYLIACDILIDDGLENQRGSSSDNVQIINIQILTFRL